VSDSPVEFLARFNPDGPWCLSAIVPDGKITTTTFTADQTELMREWIEMRRGRENIYFLVNGTNKNLTKKAKKTDISEVRWLHVDVDPTSEFFDAEREKILRRLREHVPPPTVILDSGGGYQAFWRLSKPVTARDWSELESYNRQLEVDLGADHCHNVDRIMRLPGTTNIPNRRKRQKGREEREAKLVEFNDKSYDLSTFSRAPALGGTSQGDTGRPRVELSGNLPQFSSVDDLDQHGELSAHIKMLIVQGTDPDQPEKYPSRSEALWAVLCAMVRADFADDVIAAVILDPDFEISGHILDSKSPESYAIRQIQRAREHAIQPELPSMNDEYFVAPEGGKVRVFRSVHDTAMNRRMLITYTATDFKQLFSNKKIVVGTGERGQPIEKKLGHWWLDDPSRRTYEGGITFLPGRQTAPEVFNLWQGFSCEARAGDMHNRYLEHIHENICDGNTEHAEYVINWMARVVQSPATQSQTAIVLRGGQGTGKNTFVEIFGALVADTDVLVYLGKLPGLNDHAFSIH
jgi:hypothetical protein